MTFRPVIRTQSDLEAVWHELMGPLGFAEPSVWLLLIAADDRPIPHLTQIEQADSPPARRQLVDFAETVAGLRDHVVPGGRVAFLYARPGPAGVTDLDRSWALAWYAACRLVGLPAETVHRACDDDLVPLPLDEAIPTPAA